MGDQALGDSPAHSANWPAWHRRRSARRAGRVDATAAAAQPALLDRSQIGYRPVPSAQPRRLARN